MSRYPGISEPEQTIESMHNTVLELKKLVETLSQQSGDRVDHAVTFQDLLDRGIINANQLNTADNQAANDIANAVAGINEDITGLSDFVDTLSAAIDALNALTILTSLSFKLTVLESDGTFTPQAGMVFTLVLATGGGGGGGTIDTDGSGACGGGGGQAGGTVIKLWNAAEVGANAAVTIGGGGAGDTAADGGDNGGDTVVNPAGTGATLTAGGGEGGGGTVANNAIQSTTGGSAAGGASNGDLDLSGTAGQGGMGWLNDGAVSSCRSGGGGPSFWGGGTRSRALTSAGADDGLAGNAYGAGGGGATNINQTDPPTGGDGADGVAVFLEVIVASA